MKEIKKVLFHINSLGRGGAERVVSVLANRFIEDGIDVTIVTLWRAEDEYVVNQGIKRVNLGDVGYVKNLSGKLLAIARTIALRTKIVQENPDIVISFCNKANFRASVAMTAMRIPLVTSVRNDPNKDYAPYPKAVQRMEKRAVGCVFQTSEAREFFDEEWTSNSVVIPNPIDDRYTGQLTWKGNDTGYIMTAGRLSYQKNHELLVNAYAKIADKYPAISLCIYGDESDVGSLKKLQECIKNTGIPDRIRLAGATDELPEKLSEAVCFVLSSDYEGMPNALMEAMAIGVPSISTDCPCGGPAMLIENGQSGLLVPVGDVDAMSEALDRILTDVSLRQHISKNSMRIREIADCETIYLRWKEYLKKFVR